MADIDNDLVHTWRNDSQLNTHSSVAAGSSRAGDVASNSDALKESARSDEQKPGALVSDSDVDAAFKKMVVSPKQTPVQTPYDGPGVAGPSIGASQQQSANAQDIQDKQPAGKQGSQEAGQPRRSNNTSGAARGGGHTSPAASPRGSSGRHRTVPAEFDRSKDGKRTTGRLWSPADATQGPPGSTGTFGKQLEQQNLLQHQEQHQQQHDPHQRKKKKHMPTRPRTDGQHASASQKAQQPLQHAGQSQQQPSAEAALPVMNTITHDALVDEVKGIYSGLVMVESKCMEIASVQSAYRDSNQELTKEQWQALIALHRTLLHEHHDFFLASQHPAAKQPLRQLAAKYAMPARMWRHGIHSFLELLRTKLPHSLEFMLSFIYIAYTNTALLYETIPAFEDTWVECLGDLARYRMAIEDESVKDRDIWTEVARGWYLKVSNRQPSIGRLYHHLAILARPDALQQLFYYAKSFCVSMPFPSARDSIMTLLEPVFQNQTTRELLDIDTAFIRVHGVLFSGNHKEELQPALDVFLDLLPRRLDEADKEWLQNGYHIGIALTCALLGYGEAENVIMKDMRWFKPDTARPGQPPNQRGSPECFSTALTFTTNICKIIVDRRIEATVTKEDGESEAGAVVERRHDANVLPFMHTIFAFLLSVSENEKAMTNFATAFPWAQTAKYLNALLQYCIKEEFRSRHDDTATFPGKRRTKDKSRPLPEDFAMRGLLFTEGYYPRDWFNEHDMEEDEKLFEVPSLATTRCERILWIARRLAERGSWLIWDDNEREFTVTTTT